MYVVNLNLNALAKKLYIEQHSFKLNWRLSSCLQQLHRPSGRTSSSMESKHGVNDTRPRFDGNDHVGIHFASRSIRFQSGTTSAHIAFSIYLCIVRRRFYRRRRRRGRCAAQGGILTTWLILPPAREAGAVAGGRARRTRAGFPRPRASRPLTTHGASRSAAASRAATRAAVALRPRALTSWCRDIIHANLRLSIFLPNDPTAVKPARDTASAECSWTSHRVLFHRNPSVPNQFGVLDDGAFLRMRPPVGKRCFDPRPAMLRPWPSHYSATKRKDLFVHSARVHGPPSYLHGAYEWFLFSSGRVCVRGARVCAAPGAPVCASHRVRRDGYSLLARFI